MLFVSVYENGSTDSTKMFLYLLREFLTDLKIPFNIVSEDNGRPSGTHRIAYLAETRNKALQPLYEHNDAQEFSHVLFFNDVVFCVEDVLELIMQGIVQKAVSIQYFVFVSFFMRVQSLTCQYVTGHHLRVGLHCIEVHQTTRLLRYMGRPRYSWSSVRSSALGPVCT
jgi:hypothetical protein